LGVPRLIGVDALRGVAALMVLLYHGWFGPLINQVSPEAFWLAYPTWQGFTGVHLFLLLSGFCIHARAASAGRARPFLVFWRRRLTRLYPPYLAAVGLSFLVLSGPGQNELWIALAIHATFLLPFFPVTLWNSGNIVFWTLALEEQLYLLYSPFLWLRKRLSLTRVVAVVLGATLLYRAAAVYWMQARTPMWSTPVEFLGALPAQGGAAWLTLGPARWFEWVLGAALAERYFQGKLYFSRKAGLLSLLALAAALAGQWSQPGWVLTDPCWGLFYLGVCAWTLTREPERLSARPLWKAASQVGLYSYSLYLVHVPVLDLLQPVLGTLVPQALALPLGCLLVLPCAYLFYLLFERPALEWSRRLR
jgi:peptidoglycan/LPS O-acetylase OafA/YrhL